jgi:MoaA/NifB/PqqE/SkfB family radical SAM enzyme
MKNDSVSDGQVKVYHQVLTLQLSLNCNAACRQCMVSSGSKRSRVMTLAEAKSILDELEKMTLTRFVGFTGGEIFLHYPMLLKLGRYIHQKYHYGFGVATNCYWATDRTRARKLLTPLVEVGLSELLVSLDDFHLEYIDGRRIENCVNVALELGASVTVQTIKTRTGHGVAYFQKTMDIPPPPAVRWVETPCHPAGRALSEVPDDEYIYDWKNQPGHCTALRVWNVDPYGFVTPCCGTAFAPPLQIGNVFEESLSEIVNRANVNPLLNTIAGWGGPYMLIKALETCGDGRYSEKAFASHCHACMTVLQDQEVVKVLDRELRVHWVEALASRLATQTLWYRSFALEDKNCDWLPGGWLPAEPMPGNRVAPTFEPPMAKGGSAYR